jgi:D-arabinose 1-dehydrogenase-like Zn-dependent alcohol dehydrogenase
MRLAAQIELRPVVGTYALEEAEAALDALAHGRVRGAAVLAPS